MTGYVLLFFFAHAFEGRAICFLIHKPAITGIPFHELVDERVEDLGTIADSTVTVTVAFGWVCSHK